MKGRRAVLKRALLAWGVLVAAVYAASTVAQRLPQVPYNVRELLTGSGEPLVQPLLLAGVLIFVFAGPGAMAELVLRAGTKAVLWFPMAVAGYLVMVSTALLEVAPLESIHDVVGSPIFRWPDHWELFVRLCALFLAPAVVLTGAVLIERLRGRVRDGNAGQALICWSGWAAVLLPVAYWGVVRQAATDNLVELMARGGDVWSALAAAAWVGVWAWTGSLLARAGTRPRGRAGWRSWLRTLAVLVGSVAVGYGLISLATEGEVHKYGAKFSALQFLLSPDREHLVGGAGLVLRYVLVHVGLVGVTSLAQHPLAIGRSAPNVARGRCSSGH